MNLLKQLFGINADGRRMTAGELVPTLFMLAALEGSEEDTRRVTSLAAKPESLVRRELAVAGLFGMRAAAAFGVVASRPSEEARKQFWLHFDVFQMQLCGTLQTTNEGLRDLGMALENVFVRLGERLKEEDRSKFMAFMATVRSDGKYVHARMSELAKLYKVGESFSPVVVALCQPLAPSVAGMLESLIQRVQTVTLASLDGVTIVPMGG